MSSKFKFKTIKDDFPKMQQSIEKLNGKRVDVGVMGENAWLAGIHEYGCTVTAKNSRYLTIPISPKSAGKRASDFSNLFYVESKTGEKFLARDKKINGENQIELLFWLTKSVKIPERSFLRAGFDEHHNDVVKKAEMLIPALLEGKISDEQFFKKIGIMLSTKIKEFARDLKSPSKSNVTIEAHPGKENPLVNTGKMISSITYKVE